MLPTIRFVSAMVAVLVSMLAVYSFPLSGNRVMNRLSKLDQDGMSTRSFSRSQTRRFLMEEEEDMFASDGMSGSLDEEVPVKSLDDEITELLVEADIEEDKEAAPANRELIWNAAVKSSVRVKELGRSCEEYMRLPASECKTLLSDSFDIYI